MAKQRNSNADSDQEMEDVSKRNPKDDGSEEEEEDEEEYEIEAILDAKPGVFEGVSATFQCLSHVYLKTGNMMDHLLWLWRVYRVALAI